MDIPPQSLGDEKNKLDYLERVFLRLKKNGNKIFYFDHHPNEKQFVEIFYNLKEKNLIDDFVINEKRHFEEDRVPVKDKKCATEIILDYFIKQKEVTYDSVFEKIVKFAHDQDFGIREIEDAVRISVVIGASFNNLKLIYRIANGIFWDEELEYVYVKAKEKVERLLGALSFRLKEVNINGQNKKFAYVLMPEENGLKVTPASQYIFEKTDADISVVVQRFPLVSFRARKNEKDVNVGRIAEHFGGGGHQGAATFKDYKGKYIDFKKIDEKNFPEVVEKKWLKNCIHFLKISLIENYESACVCL